MTQSVFIVDEAGVFRENNWQSVGNARLLRYIIFQRLILTFGCRNNYLVSVFYHSLIRDIKSHLLFLSCIYFSNKHIQHDCNLVNNFIWMCAIWIRRCGMDVNQTPPSRSFTYTDMGTFASCWVLAFIIFFNYIKEFYDKNDVTCIFFYSM